MSTLCRKLATLAAALVLVSLSSSDASAQHFAKARAYYQGFYGQNFYDGQGHGPHGRQFHGGIYGPAMMYGRQYADEYGYITAKPFTRPLPPAETQYLGEAPTY